MWVDGLCHVAAGVLPTAGRGHLVYNHLDNYYVQRQHQEGIERSYLPVCTRRERISGQDWGTGV